MSSLIAVFWTVSILFVLVILGMTIRFIPLPGWLIGLPSLIILMVLGVVLVVLASKADITKTAKAFFLLTGSASIGIGLSILLHNLVFALMVRLFGQQVWASMGDEPVFFLFATIIFPLALLSGIIGCIVLMVKKRIWV